MTTESPVRALPERAGDDGPFVLRQATLSWPLAHAVRRGEFLQRFAAQVVTTSRPGSEDGSMTLAEAVELNSGSCRQSPWYVSWNVHEYRDQLVGDLPSEFESWYEWLPAKFRPLWTWIFVGATGTGTPLHVDTMGSSAWNALMSGTKEWRIMSPRRSVRAGLLREEVSQTLAEAGDFEYTCVQHPGDLMVVPAGWAHAVTNVGDTVSVTGNYVNASNIDVVDATLASTGNDTWREITRRVRAAAETAGPTGRG